MCTFIFLFCELVNEVHIKKWALWISDADLDGAIVGGCRQICVVWWKTTVIDWLQVAEQGILASGFVQIPQLQEEKKNNKGLNPAVIRWDWDSTMDISLCRSCSLRRLFAAPTESLTFTFKNLSLEHVARRTCLLRFVNWQWLICSSCSSEKTLSSISRSKFQI